MVREKTGEKKTKKNEVFSNQLALDDLFVIGYKSAKHTKCLKETEATLVNASLSEIANRAQLILNTYWSNYIKNRSKNKTAFEQYCTFEKLFASIGLTIKYRRNDFNKNKVSEYFLINHISVYYNGSKSDSLMSHIILSDRRTPLQRLAAELSHDYFRGCKIARIEDESIVGIINSFSLSTDRSVPRFSVKNIENYKSTKTTWNVESCYVYKYINGKQHRLNLSFNIL